MTRRERKNVFAGLGFTSLWIIGLVVFTGYPVLASLYFSFCDYSILKAPVWSGLENYRQLVHDELFWKSLRNTLFYAGLAVPLGTVKSRIARGILQLREILGVIDCEPASAPVNTPANAATCGRARGSDAFA